MALHNQFYLYKVLNAVILAKYYIYIQICARVVVFSFGKKLYASVEFTKTCCLCFFLCKIRVNVFDSDLHEIFQSKLGFLS